MLRLNPGEPPLCVPPALRLDKNVQSVELEPELPQRLVKIRHVSTSLLVEPPGLDHCPPDLTQSHKRGLNLRPFGRARPDGEQLARVQVNPQPWELPRHARHGAIVRSALARSRARVSCVSDAFHPSDSARRALIPAFRCREVHGTLQRRPVLREGPGALLAWSRSSEVDAHHVASASPSAGFHGGEPGDGRPRRRRAAPCSSCRSPATGRRTCRRWRAR